MTHFGIMCPDTGGHLGPMLSIARTLQGRGHRVTFFQRSLLKKHVIQASGIGFRSYANNPEHPDADALSQRLGETGGWRGFKATIDSIRESTAECLASAPALLRQERVDALLIDEVIVGGTTLAELLEIPCIVLSIALLLEGEPSIPPFFTTWKFREDGWALARNRIAYKFHKLTVRPLRNDVARFRSLSGLDSNGSNGSFATPVVRISQQPAEFEFPRRHLPDRLHFVGPLSDPSIRKPVEFPFDRLDGRPLIYASLGTVLGTRRDIFQRIAEACAPLNTQLVISLGGRGKPSDLGQLPGSPLVVQQTPQLEILKHAAVCITHAGLNTTLECLAEGVPMVAIPMVNDAPGVAARIAWTGSGLHLIPSRLTAKRLRARVQRVLNEPPFRVAAGKMRNAIQLAGGLTRAADLIESAIGMAPRNDRAGDFSHPKDASGLKTVLHSG